MSLALITARRPFPATSSAAPARRRSGRAAAVREPTWATETKFVEMHEGSKPFWKTPKIIPTKHPPLDPASQAR